MREKKSDLRKPLTAFCLRKRLNCRREPNWKCFTKSEGLHSAGKSHKYFLPDGCYTAKKHKIKIYANNPLIFRDSMVIYQGIDA